MNSTTYTRCIFKCFKIGQERDSKIVFLAHIGKQRDFIISLLTYYMKERERTLVHMIP